MTVGYLVWFRGMNGNTSPSRVDAMIWEGCMPDTKKRLSSMIVGEAIALDDVQYRMSFDELVKAHPAPQQEV